MMERLIYNRGIAKVDLQDYTGAIADYNKAIEIDPTDAIIYYDKATNEARINDYLGAIADFNKAIEINPKYADAYTNRGFA